MTLHGYKHSRKCVHGRARALSGVDKQVSGNSGCGRSYLGPVGSSFRCSPAGSSLPADLFPRRCSCSFPNFPLSRKCRRWLSTEAPPPLPRPLPSVKPVGERRRAAPHCAGKFGTAVARATIAVTLCRREIQQPGRPRPFPPPVGCPSRAMLGSLQMCKLLCEAPTALVLRIHSTSAGQTREKKTCRGSFLKACRKSPALSQLL